MSDESPDPVPPSEPSEPSSGGLAKWVLPAAAGAIILALVVALIVVLAGGGDDSADAASAASSKGPSPEYVSAVTGPVRRLNASAKVTGRSLTRASREKDIALIARSADQQLVVVQAARSQIADIQTGPREAAARGALSRATQSHRALLTSLSRIDTLDTAKARAQVGKVRNQARSTLEQYRAFFSQVPSAPKGITAAGLADLSGLTQAIAARQRAEAQAAADAEAAADAAASRGSGGPSSGSSGSSSSGALQISRAYGSDNGGVIEVGADYCDRTPGAVNEFVYTFQIRSGGAVLAEDGYTASQTRACNTVSLNFSDEFYSGSYEVVVSVNNLTNNVSATATGSLTVN